MFMRERLVLWQLRRKLEKLGWTKIISRRHPSDSQKSNFLKQHFAVLQVLQVMGAVLQER